MFLSHRIALYPTDKQRRYFAKAAGCDRFCWNIAVDEWNRRYLSGEKTDWMEIRRNFNEFKYEAFTWMRGLHRDSHSDAFERLGKAWTNHFGNTKKTGRPTFHKKGRRESFYVACDRVRVDGGMVRLPVIGWVRAREELRFHGKIIGATVSRTADRWFVAIQVEVLDEKAKSGRSGNGIIGVDVGISSAATLSTGEKIEAPRPLHKERRRIRRFQRRASRQKKGSKNQKNQYRKIARTHARVANIRRDFWHKQTTRLCRENQAICIEGLNVKGMARNRKLARALADVGFGMMKPMLEYKSKIYGNTLVIADKWFPSSKKCSNCGHAKDKLALSERLYVCESCGFECDRDVNAARNLRNLIPTACGESMPADWERLVKAPREAGTSRPCIRQDALSSAL